MAASKTRKAPAISANIQWAALTGIAIVALVAVFVFGIGNTNSGGGHGGGGHSGAPALVTTN